MPFTVRDFQSLGRALERRAEWKAELRRAPGIARRRRPAPPPDAAEDARAAGVWRVVDGRAEP